METNNQNNENSIDNTIIEKGKKSTTLNIIRWITLVPAIAIAFFGVLLVLSFFQPIPWTQALFHYGAMLATIIIITPSKKAQKIVILFLSIAYIIYGIDGFLFYWNAPYEFDSPMTNAEEIQFYTSGMIIALMGLIGSIIMLVRKIKMDIV